MQERLRRFMMGRYGNDDLNIFIFIVTVILIVAEMITRSRILYYLPVLAIVLAYFRMLSKNHSKRYAENQKYLAIKSKILGLFGKKSSRGYKTEEMNHIFRCPQCKQKIRIPKGKGKVRITCPKCGYSFIKKS